MASPPLAGGAATRSYSLELRATSEGGASVREHLPSMHLPCFCPERHINPDGTFCIYYGSEAALANGDAVAAWWESLAAFLNNQQYAEKWRVWPLASGLSHGDAAAHQLEMEAIADPLGWKDEILSSMFRSRGWLAGRLPRACKQLDRVLNVRMPCPRGCTRKHRLLRRRSCEIDSCAPGCRRMHKPILRADCPHRNAVENLVLHEYRRRRLEAEFFKALRKAGHQCCGTMKGCPLAK